MPLRMNWASKIANQAAGEDASNFAGFTETGAIDTGGDGGGLEVILLGVQLW